MKAPPNRPGPLCLALIDGGVSTPYELQKTAGLFQGATIPALQRLLEAQIVRRGKPGARGRTDYKVTAAGRKVLKAGWLPLIDAGPSRDVDSDLRVALLAILGGGDSRVAAEFLREAAYKKMEVQATGLSRPSSKGEIAPLARWYGEMRSDGREGAPRQPSARSFGPWLILCLVALLARLGAELLPQRSRRAREGVPKGLLGLLTASDGLPALTVSGPPWRPLALHLSLVGVEEGQLQGSKEGKVPLLARQELAADQLQHHSLVQPWDARTSKPLGIWLEGHGPLWRGCVHHSSVGCTTSQSCASGEKGHSLWIPSIHKVSTEWEGPQQPSSESSVIY